MLMPLGPTTVAATHRYIAPMRTSDGRAVAVKMTVKETAGSKEPNPLYSIEAIAMEKPALDAPETGIERGIGQDRQPPQAGFAPNLRALVDTVNRAEKTLRGTLGTLVAGNADNSSTPTRSVDAIVAALDAKAKVDGFTLTGSDRAVDMLAPASTCMRSFWKTMPQRKKPVPSRPAPILMCSGVSNPVGLASMQISHVAHWQSTRQTYTWWSMPTAAHSGLPRHQERRGYLRPEEGRHLRPRPGGQGGVSHAVA
jgi:hypothetical protein